MRADMATVVTERPRQGSRNRGQKWGGRLTPAELRAINDGDWAWVDEGYGCLEDQTQFEDYGPAGKLAWSRRRNYDYKTFSDVLGPLRGYLRRQVGRPWDDVYSELSRTLSKRSLTGIHIWDHVRTEVEVDCWQGESGRVYPLMGGMRLRFGGTPAPVTGLYVHPMTRRLCYAEGTYRHRWGKAGRTPAARAHREALGWLGVYPRTAEDARRYRVTDRLRLWERDPRGWWLLHVYEDRGERRETVVGTFGWRKGKTYEVVYPAGRVRVRTKQAGWRDMREAWAVLEADPLVG